MIPRPPRAPLFPYTTLFRSSRTPHPRPNREWHQSTCQTPLFSCRSEEHTSELQSHLNLVCRLLLEKKSIIISSNVDKIALHTLRLHGRCVRGMTSTQSMPVA